MQLKDLATKKCLICENTGFMPFLELKDYFLSQEEFALINCQSCGLLYTIPQPDESSIYSYYESEDYASHNTRKFSLKNILYQQSRKFTLGHKLSLIKKYVRKGKILDIGSGTGEFLLHCRKNGWDVTGIEPNEIARKKAIVDYGLSILKPEEISRIENKSKNVISMWHVLEHLQNPLEQFKTSFRLLNEDGLFVVALPNYESWDAKHYGKYWAAYDVPRHLFHFSENSIAILAERTGFEIHEVRPLKLDAYYISLLSEKYIHGNINYCKAFINGWRSNRIAKMNKSGYSSLVYLLRKK